MTLADSVGYGGQRFAPTDEDGNVVAPERASGEGSNTENIVRTTPVAVSSTSPYRLDLLKLKSFEAGELGTLGRPALYGSRPFTRQVLTDLKLGQRFIISIGDGGDGGLGGFSGDGGRPGRGDEEGAVAGRWGNDGRDGKIGKAGLNGVVIITPIFESGIDAALTDLTNLYAGWSFNGQAELFGTGGVRFTNSKNAEDITGNDNFFDIARANLLPEHPI